MIFTLLKSLFAALSCAFDVAVDLFDAVGFPWQAAVIMMVVVSVVLRLFTSSFIGHAIHVNIEARNSAKASAEAKRQAIRAKEERKATETLRIKSGKEVL